MTPGEIGPCQACRRCIGVCDARAIVFVDGRARIDGRQCMGCAKCVRICPLTAEGLRSSLYSPFMGE